jgi:fido (protein-threonine AMPylation protein)
VSSDLFAEPDGATLLSPDEQRGLRPTWITTRADLNEAEADNIVKGLVWTRRRLDPPSAIATDSFCRNLHRQMFGDVWSWAGSYRTTERNLGVSSWRIANDCAV